MMFRSDIDAILALEDGDPLMQEEYVEAYQYLINSGTVWHLQGSHCRNAAALLDEGLCTETTK